MTVETVPEVAAKRSRWEDFVDVYLAPADLFRARAQDSWVVPFVLLCVIATVLYYAFLPINGALIQAAMLENAPANADPERVAQGANMMKLFGGITIWIGSILMIAWSAVAIKLVSSLFEPAAKWGEAFMISTFSMFVAIPQQIVGTLLVFLKNRTGTVEMKDVSFGVLRFVDKPDAILRTLLGRFDLFPLWSAVLVAVALVVVVKMSRTKAILTSAIVWLAIALPGLAMAALTGGARK